MDQLLNVDVGKSSVRTALLTGPAGAGKSTYIRRYVYNWSKAPDKDKQRQWDLVVIVNMRTLRLTSQRSTDNQIMEILRQSLPGRQVEALMMALTDQALKVLVIADGLDQCRSRAMCELLSEMLDGAQSGKLAFSMLVTCVTGLCPLTEDHFDRKMTLEGFTVQQGIQYMRNYFTHIQKMSSTSTLEYVPANKGKLEAILTNPLNTQMFCFATASGSLKLTEGNPVKRRDLLSAVEDSVTGGQSKEHKKGQSRSSSKQDMVILDPALESHATRFYKLALYTLVKDIRTFDAELLGLFNIQSGNPYLKFLNTSTINHLHGNKPNSEYHFSHELLHEHLATCALQNLPEDAVRHFLLLLCHKREFQNARRIMFSTMGEDKDKLNILSDMLRASTLLQCDVSEQLSQRDEIIDLQEQIDLLMTGDTSLHLLQPTSDDTSDDSTVTPEPSSSEAIWEVVNKMYEKDVKQAQKGGLFWELVTGGLVQHLFQCLGEVPDHHRARVFDASLKRILPSS